MSLSPGTWPNGKRLAVSVAVMFEAWSDDKAPTYSVQTSSLSKDTVDHAAKAWATYGGRVGVWRLIRMLDRHQIPGTFFTTARCVELYPDAVRQIVRSGHDVAGHSYTHDRVLADLTPEEQRATIRQSVDMLQDHTGQKVTGWGSPVVAFTPETAGILVQEGLSWHNDVTYLDLPHKVRTPYGVIAGVPTSDFSDNRVLRASPRDLYDVYRGAFDYLLEHEPTGLLVMALHCQFGGRPLMTAVIEELFNYMKRSSDVWWVQPEELGRWALEQDTDELSYERRFFNGPHTARAAE